MMHYNSIGQLISLSVAEQEDLFAVSSTSDGSLATEDQGWPESSANCPILSRNKKFTTRAAVTLSTELWSQTDIIRASRSNFTGRPTTGDPTPATQRCYKKLGNKGDLSGPTWKFSNVDQKGRARRAIAGPEHLRPRLTHRWGRIGIASLNLSRNYKTIPYPQKGPEAIQVYTRNSVRDNIMKRQRVIFLEYW